MSNQFPSALDVFPALITEGVLDASVANSYQQALIACEVELETLQRRAAASTQTYVGLCWRVQVTCTTLLDNSGTGSKSAPFRYRRTYHPVDTKFYISWGSGSHEAHFIGSSQTPPNSFITLPLPNLGSLWPNGAPFHANNISLVTVEAQQEVETGNAYNETFWVDSPPTLASQDNHVGGFRALDGLLYYANPADLNPQVVLSDWSPQTGGKEKNNGAADGLMGDVFTAFVHLVIMG